MVYYRVVSTKLTEEEHSRLLDVCNIVGCPPSAMIKEAILRVINTGQKASDIGFNVPQISVRESSAKHHQINEQPQHSELARLLGIDENQQNPYNDKITRRWT
ncbi:MAG: hypothetical protein ACREBI_11850 [Nitrosotalea sp.]